MPPNLSTFLLSIGGIILVDLSLSGDNALVIGAVASRIQQRRRRLIALGIGGVGAILLRVLFTASATFLLSIPYLQALGGLLVLVIGIRLLFEDDAAASSDSNEAEADEQLPLLARIASRWMGQKMAGKTTSGYGDFLMAIVTITIADLTMSLDNIVAIGALAHKQVLILTIGLILSIALLIVGSALISELVSRIPWLIIFASFILAWVAADLIWNDISAWPFIKENELYHYGLMAIFMALVLVVAIVIRVRRRRASPMTVAEPRVLDLPQEARKGP